MGNASMKSIKLRIKSMESTKQITKAMQMVASSKLRHARERVIASRPYFEILYSTISDIVAANSELSSVFTQEREVKNTYYVVFAGDRGLAGGYNANVLKHALADIKSCQGTPKVIPVGKRAVDFFRKNNIEIVTEAYAIVETVSLGDCFAISKEISKAFLTESCDEVKLVYTRFTSMLSQNPALVKLLPLNKEAYKVDETAKASQVLYEPSPEEAFDAFVPEYIGGMIYGALCESYASELAARSNAMDSATKNAEELIDSLSLTYNRARQGAITQEITEIVAGAEH